MGITLSERLHLAPVDPDCKHALDFATGENFRCHFLCALLTEIYLGTGLWAIEFAQQYPDAQVLGTDLSAIQPEL
jgi:hypothetical protein